MASPLELPEGTSTASTLSLDFQPPKLGESPSQLSSGTWLVRCVKQLQEAEAVLHKCQERLTKYFFLVLISRSS